MSANNIDGQEMSDELSRRDTSAGRGNVPARETAVSRQVPMDEALATINATLAETAVNGRLQQVEIWKEMQALKAMIVDLKTAVDNATPTDGWERTPAGDPICPRHGEAMRKREKQGDVWHSHSVTASDGQTVYCKGYAGKNSPGFEHGKARVGYVEAGAAVVAPPSKMSPMPVDGSNPVTGVRPVVRQERQSGESLPAGSTAVNIKEFCHAADEVYPMFGNGAGSLSFFNTVFGEGVFNVMSARGYAAAFQTYVRYVNDNPSSKKATLHNAAKERMLGAYRTEMGNG